MRYDLKFHFRCLPMLSFTIKHAFHRIGTTIVELIFFFQISLFAFFEQLFPLVLIVSKAQTSGPNNSLNAQFRHWFWHKKDFATTLHRPVLESFCVIVAQSKILVVIMAITGSGIVHVAIIYQT